MVINERDLVSMPEFAGAYPGMLTRKLSAIELLIRSYTHNNFQNRAARFEAESSDDLLLGATPYIKADDTIQITKSQVNDGLYVVKEIKDGMTVINGELYPVPYNLITKVEYPKDIQDGVINMLLWEMDNRQTVGVKSETLSRHSVTYYDLDANNQVMGYPVSLLGFLKPYMKARF